MPEDQPIGGQVVGLEATLYNLKVLDQEFHAAAVEATRNAGDFYMEKLAHHAGLKDHSLKELARLDHPYARRHGRIKKLEGHGFWWQVHQQGGEMAGSMFRKYEVREVPLGVAGITSYVAAFIGGFEPGKVDHVPMVILGTRHMLPRPVVRLTLEANLTSIKKVYIKTMGAAETKAWGKFKKVRAAI